jgi:2'-hydroxyisoflavone reductase
MNRRELLIAAIAAALAGGQAADAAPTPRRVLILGGTGFIGPHFVREALAHGHKVTLFNRGKSQTQPTPGVETLIGDRDGQLDALRGRDWDVVIDNSGYVPRHVQLTTRLLADRTDHYLFISTIAVYADLSGPGTTESAPLKVLADPTVEEVGAATYGGLKALCERPVLEDFSGRSTIVRPTYIVGPGDDTDRFTYWPWRVARGGDMLAPGTALDPIQYIDVRDLARFVIACATRPVTGTFNACTPPGYATMGDLIETSRRQTGAATRVHWVDAEFLRESGALDGPGLPIWRAPVGPTAGVALVSSAAAVQAGLRFTPLDDTVRATLDWQKTRPEAQQHQLEAGLTPEREAELLKQWQARAAG